MKRATLLSTLVIDGLKPASLRRLLDAVGGDLHLNEGNPPSPLGSRNLLQRIALAAVLLENFRPALAIVPALVRQAEGKAPAAADAELQAELVQSHQRVRDIFGPLTFLYDLRLHGGLAHTPNKARAGEAAGQLGLPTEGWHRSDYLQLLNLVSESVRRIAQDFGTVVVRTRHR